MTSTNVMVVGDFLVERLLVLGEGYDTYTQHTVMKAAEQPILSLNRGGGAALTRALLNELGKNNGIKVHAVELPKDPWNAVGGPRGSQQHMLARQTIGLMRAPLLPGSSQSTYRAERTLSFDFIPLENRKFLNQLGMPTDENPDNIVIEDFNLGGYDDGDESEILGRAAERAKCAVLKTTRPAHWTQTISSLGATNGHPFVILGSIDSFFVNKGVASRSWDEVVRNIHKELKTRGCEGALNWRLVLMCKSEGVLLAYSDEKRISIKIAFDARVPLGGLSHRTWGWVPGCQNIMAASLASEAIPEDPAALWEKVQSAWGRARRASFLGHGSSSLEDITASDSSKKPIAEVTKRVADYKTRLCQPSRHKQWSMLSEQFHDALEANKKGLQQLAFEVVRRGPKALTSNERPEGGDPKDAAFVAKKLAGSIPVHTIGALALLDREETEQLSTMIELIRDYAQRPQPPRPLSIAVFGRPGSGKSFGVKQILGHLKIPAETLTFNLSQFSTPDELPQALQAVQTAGLKGQLPVVFWDEFDSPLDEQDKGWLRCFLAPMQDGEFLNNGDRQVIGRSIFVFAGGICHHSSEFFDPSSKGKKVGDDKKAKVPDFASRIKLVYNVPSVSIGEDPLDDPSSFATVLRRALIVRHNLKEHAPHLRQVSNRVLARLLFDQVYETARDLETAIESAAISNVDRFGESQVPTPLWGQKIKTSDLVKATAPGYTEID